MSKSSALKEIENQIRIEETKLLNKDLTIEHKYHLKGRISAMYYCMSIIKYKIK